MLMMRVRAEFKHGLSEVHTAMMTLQFRLRYGPFDPKSGANTGFRGSFRGEGPVCRLPIGCA